jgi:hypothetical protein
MTIQCQLIRRQDWSYLQSIIAVYGGKKEFVPMKVFLDDLRETPVGWHRTYSVAETIQFIETRQVSELSLDNDLGKDQPEGYLALNHLEMLVFNDASFHIPIITVHSSNASRIEDMERGIESIHRIRNKQLEDIDQQI